MLTPRSNVAVEQANRMILNGLKTILDKVNGRWADFLPSALWAYRMTPRETTGDTPFHLTYGTKAMVPIEIRVQSPRVLHIQEDPNEEALRCNLDLLEEQ